MMGREMTGGAAPRRNLTAPCTEEQDVSESVEPDRLREIAVEVARGAGEVLHGFAVQRAAGDDLDVSTKTSATDPVSDADRAAEAHISEALASLRPDDGLLAEEGGATRRGSSGLRWVVDPLDGTVNFLYGSPLWCTSVACVDESGTVAGAVVQPASGEVFHAARDGGARCGEAVLSCSAVADLAHTLVATGFSYEPDVRVDQGVEVADLLTRVRDLRRGGSAALDLAWTAAGRVDGYVEFGLQPWDWAAGRLLVTEAGGRVSAHRRHLGGRDLDGVVAGGTAAHDNLVSWLDQR